MKLEDALYRAVTGRSPATAGGSVRSMVDELRGVHGTHAPPDIPDRTWRRLRAEPDRKYSPVTIARLRAAQAAARLTPTKRARVAGAAHVGISGTFTVSSDTRDRRIIVTKWSTFPAGLGAEIARAYDRGELADEADLIHARISAEVGGMRLEEDHPISVRFFPDFDSASSWTRT